jgi:hypothetical protein
MRGQTVIKCGCGLPLRRKDWATHWPGRRVGSANPASEQDVRDLEAQEARTAAEEASIQEWLAPERVRRSHSQTV